MVSRRDKPSHWVAPTLEERFQLVDWSRITCFTFRKENDVAELGECFKRRLMNGRENDDSFRLG